MNRVTTLYSSWCGLVHSSWSLSSLLYLRRRGLGSFSVKIDIPAPDGGSFLLTSFMWSFWWQKSLFSFSSVISSKMKYSSVAFQPLLNRDFLLLIYILALVEICRVTHERSWDLNDKCLPFELLADVYILVLLSGKNPTLIHTFSWFLVFLHLLLPLSEKNHADTPELPWVIPVAVSRDKLTFLTKRKWPG